MCGGIGSIPGQGNKIPHAVGYDQKVKKKKKKKNDMSKYSESVCVCACVFMCARAYECAWPGLTSSVIAERQDYPSIGRLSLQSAPPNWVNQFCVKRQALGQSSLRSLNLPKL